MNLQGIYFGLMSGTSLDGIDAVALELGAGTPRVLGHIHRPYPPALRAEFDALNRSGSDELHRAQLAAVQLAELSALAVADLLRSTGLQAGAVRGVGAHGQTVRHRPDCGYTLQLNAPALLAERCGIAVVADFRSRDVAAGGQGAPLVPAFHQALFARAGQELAVLNLGGIANLSLLRADGGVLGFDTGPANTLLDLWIAQQRGLDYDADGAWAAGGSVHHGLLATLLAEPYFAAPIPKSTGRDLFHAAWLQRALALHPGIAPQDVQTTLAELTAASVADALKAHQPACTELLVCGGGAANADLLGRLRRLLPDVEIADTGSRGLPPQQVEAAAFAWLAARTLAGLSGNCPAVTGAGGERVLGAIYPA